MGRLLRQLGFLAMFVLVGFYVLAMFASPGGWPAMLERREEMNRLERQNDDLRKQIQTEGNTIRDLEAGGPARERVIREQTKKQKRSETTIYFEDPAAQPAK